MSGRQYRAGYTDRLGNTTRGECATHISGCLPTYQTWRGGVAYLRSGEDNDRISQGATKPARIRYGLAGTRKLRIIEPFGENAELWIISRFGLLVQSGPGSTKIRRSGCD